MIKAFHSVMTKILAAALSLTAICCVAACAGEKPAEENVEISLNKTEIEIYEGETFRLTVPRWKKGSSQARKRAKRPSPRAPMKRRWNVK